MSGETCCEFSIDNVKENKSDEFDMYTLIKSQKPHWNELIKQNMFSSSTFGSSIFRPLFNPELYLNKLTYWIAFGMENKQDIPMIFQVVLKLTREYLGSCSIEKQFEEINESENNNFDNIVKCFCKALLEYIYHNTKFDKYNTYIIYICLRLGEKNHIKKVFNDFFECKKPQKIYDFSKKKYINLSGKDRLNHIKLTYLTVYHKLY
jgi:hypothetical protein